MSQIPNRQVFSKTKTASFAPIWKNLRSKLIYDPASENTNPAIFFARLALWMNCILYPATTSLSTLQNAELAEAFIHNQVLVLSFALALALIVAYSKIKHSILYALLIPHIAIFITFCLCIPPVVLYGSDTNYYTFLPVIALSYLTLLLIWSEYPKILFVFSLIHAVATVSAAIIFDPTWHEQIAAFYIFFFIVISIFMFNIVIRQMVSKLHTSVVQARASAFEAATNDKMLNLAVEVNFPALICFDTMDALIAKRGEIAHQFMPIPGADGSPVNLTAFLRHFRAQFGVDLSARNDSSKEIGLNGRHFLISRRDSSDIVAFAFIDITERIEQEERLHESQKLGIIGEITSGIAHDYNNLLAIMLSNLEAIPKSKREAIWSPYLDTTYKSIDQAKMISAKLLTISGKRDFELKTTSIGDVIADIEPLLKTAVGDEIALKVDIKDRLYVATDMNELSSAVLNMVVNARNAINHNDGQITVTVFEQTGKAIIEVLDNGTGIAESNLKKVFDPFYTTKNRESSTGLGLSLVDSFVKHCGGNIQLQSRFGHTRFRLCFPKAPPPPELPAQAANEMADDLAHDTENQRILLVDDNVDLARSMELLLTSKGYACQAVTSPKEAIALVKQDQNFTTAILDLSMPDLNGIELSHQIRPYLPDAKFILLTGDIDNITEQTAKDSGFEFVLMKPIKMHNLMAKISPPDKNVKTIRRKPPHKNRAENTLHP